MEEKKDGIISVEAEKIIPMTKGEWKEFQKQMRMEGDYFYMVGNKKYVHYDGEDYLRMEDYRTREILLNGTKPLEVEDTPEQKEEWEFDLRNLMYRDGEQLRSAGEGKPYTGEYRELVVSMIKNLLSEREREAREEGFREGADIVESDYIRKVKKLEKRLSKLTTK